jgi:hypothetical protein
MLVEEHKEVMRLRERLEGLIFEWGTFHPSGENESEDR